MSEIYEENICDYFEKKMVWQNFPEGFLPAVQINGRRILGPPLNWRGAPPSNQCELFIRNIPKYFTEDDLIPHLQRFGKIYELRLMMDFNELNRGYGYVKYYTVEEACRAMQVLNHLFITPGRLLHVRKSYNKCRLFVGNLPKHLTEEELERDFKGMFPKMQKIVMHNRISDGSHNRGFVFLDFPTHKDALEVKKQLNPGQLRKYNRDLKIVWANPENTSGTETVQTVKTLFIRNVHMKAKTEDIYSVFLQHVEQRDILKVSRFREFAFAEFTTRKIAEFVLNSVKDSTLLGYPLQMEWAIPPAADSVHVLRNNDFDAVLRLKCIANNWSVPVVIFGRVFEQERVQYAAIMIRNGEKTCVQFFEISTKLFVDIHSRLCEVFVILIEKCHGLPTHNYALKIDGDLAHIFGMVIDINTATLMKASGIRENMFIFWDEIQDLIKIISRLQLYSHAEILKAYQSAIKEPFPFIYLQCPTLHNRILGCVPDTYRRKPPLQYNLNNSQIILVLCDLLSHTNYMFPPVCPRVYNFKDLDTVNNSKCRYSVLNLLPSRLTQSRNPDGLITNVLHYGVPPGSVVTVCCESL